MLERIGPKASRHRGALSRARRQRRPGRRTYSARRRQVTTQPESGAVEGWASGNDRGRIALMTVKDELEHGGRCGRRRNWRRRSRDYSHTSRRRQPVRTLCADAASMIPDVRRSSARTRGVSARHDWPVPPVLDATSQRAADVHDWPSAPTGRHQPHGGQTLRGRRRTALRSVCLRTEHDSPITSGEVTCDRGRRGRF